MKNAIMVSLLTLVGVLTGTSASAMDKLHSHSEIFEYNYSDCLNIRRIVSRENYEYYTAKTPIGQAMYYNNRSFRDIATNISNNRIKAQYGARLGYNSVYAYNNKFWNITCIPEVQLFYVEILTPAQAQEVLFNIFLEARLEQLRIQSEIQRIK
jgi:hypothetical protein